MVPNAENSKVDRLKMRDRKRLFVLLIFIFRQHDFVLKKPEALIKLNVPLNTIKMT